MKLKYVIVALYYLITVSSVDAQDFSESFGFENEISNDQYWKMRSRDGQIMTVDDRVQGKRAWRLNASVHRFHSYIYAYFNLPESADEIELSLHSKTKNIDCALLKLWCLDVDENVLKKDSISIATDDEWQRKVVHSLCPGTEKLYIEVEVKQDKSEANNFKVESALFVDNMQLIVDGKVTVLNSEDDKNIIEDNSILNVIPDSLIEKNISLIPDFSGPRVIALGESMHGSGSISQCVYTTIKHLISDENYRLVLFEINFELGLWLNEYVSNNIEVEEVEKRLIGYNLDFIMLIDLLDWIKKYNVTSEEKVIVLGMDMYIPMLNIPGFDHLSDLLKACSPNLDDIHNFSDYCKKLEYEKAKTYIIESNFFGINDAIKRRCILRAIQLRQTQLNFHPLLLYDRRPGNTLIEGDRDLIQFQNTRFVIDSLLYEGQKAIVYAHLGHVNKKNIFSGRLYIPSLGYYLNQYYKDDYFVIALLIGKGSYSNTDSSGNFNSSLPLLIPVKGSIEELLLESNAPYLYTRTSSLGKTYFSRNIGMYSTENQFYPYSCKSRFDAIMFLSHGKGYELPPNWPKTQKELMNYFNDQRVKNGHDRW